MPLKAKDLKISFDMDEWTYGDWLDAVSGNLVKFFDVCERRAEIEGVEREKVGETIRLLGWDQVGELQGVLLKVLTEQANPVDEETGKN